ncbi:hypothetical protein NIIDNTM18_42310 [Mycolicibacterium litorale]|uniref:Uncharacterized protein n=1 Tax=Mycolicibacterium litorale TaxID=758802 RepID=A0A6S6P513_9MYCO|nr:hypothetical protein [Mycolicibacterium litorale]BCI54953.1 hypothetical protein NIIDNTM18_42310 [Mycolicibacterium litorale]
MSMANQIGLGACLALMPYAAWCLTRPALDHIARLLRPGSDSRPVHLQATMARVHLHGIPDA